MNENDPGASVPYYGNRMEINTWRETSEIRVSFGAAPGVQVEV